MSTRTKYSFDEERFVALLKDAVSKVNTEEDPDMLNVMKKLFKENVPFNRRMYVAAYLAKQVAFGSRSSFRGGRDYQGRSGAERGRPDKSASSDFRMRRPVSDSAEPKAPSRRVVIDEEVATTLFVSIGRNRRVFPRDLVGLLIQVGGVERERIGDIRTLENYSFVQVFKEDADKIISALDGYEYRGRRLSVSPSRKKEDKVLGVESEDSAVSSDSEPYAPGEEENLSKE